jgi:uncharacterized membrane protein HdeD (DUF308 family)
MTTAAPGDRGGSGKRGFGTVLLGILTVIAGMVAIGSPFIAGLLVKIIVGWALIIGGILQVLACIRAEEGWQKRAFLAVCGLLSLLCGAYVLARPLQALLALTLLLAAYFLADGLTKVMHGFKMKPARGWGFLVFSGVITLLLGIMIWRQWPASGEWALGLLFGINLLFTGWSMILLGGTARPQLKSA